MPRPEGRRNRLPHLLSTVVVLCGAFACLVAAQTSPTKGKDLFERRCGGCHTMDREKTGPRLGGVYGRAAASVPTFGYSDALKAAHITWNAETLDKWLADPDKLVPDNDMSFRLENADERREIIAYLQRGVASSKAQ
jgi:cytochrome c